MTSLRGGALPCPIHLEVWSGFWCALKFLSARRVQLQPIAPASPWQKAFAERLIGSIRRECVDHIIVLGEAHLRRILRCYARYCNEIRTYRALNKDAPRSCALQQVEIIKSHAILGGLHHQYVRI